MLPPIGLITPEPPTPPNNPPAPAAISDGLGIAPLAPALAP